MLEYSTNPSPIVYPTMTKNHHHISPPITYRLKVLHIRHTHLSKLEAQYPDCDELTSNISYPIFNKPTKSRPFSVFSSSGVMSNNNSILNKHSLTSDTNSTITGSSTLASSSMNHPADSLTSSKNKIQLKYRGLMTTNEEILPSA